MSNTETQRRSAQLPLSRGSSLDLCGPQTHSLPKGSPALLALLPGGTVLWLGLHENHNSQAPDLGGES